MSVLMRERLAQARTKVANRHTPKRLSKDLYPRSFGRAWVPTTRLKEPVPAFFQDWLDPVISEANRLAFKPTAIKVRLITHDWRLPLTQRTKELNLTYRPVDKKEIHPSLLTQECTLDQLPDRLMHPMRYRDQSLAKDLMEILILSPRKRNPQCTWFAVRWDPRSGTGTWEWALTPEEQDSLFPNERLARVRKWQRRYWDPTQLPAPSASFADVPYAGLIFAKILPWDQLIRAAIEDHERPLERLARERDPTLAHRQFWWQTLQEVEWIRSWMICTHQWVSDPIEDSLILDQEGNILTDNGMKDLPPLRPGRSSWISVNQPEISMAQALAAFKTGRIPRQARAINPKEPLTFSNLRWVE